MASSTQFVVVLVTAPSPKVARGLARLALENRLAACANLIPKIESHYWWQGRIESSSEVLILFKTTRRRVAALRRIVTTAHPYETPEFIALTVSQGARNYLDWIAASTRA